MVLSYMNSRFIVAAQPNPTLFSGSCSQIQLQFTKQCSFQCGGLLNPDKSVIHMQDFYLYRGAIKLVIATPAEVHAPRGGPRCSHACGSMPKTTSPLSWWCTSCYLYCSFVFRSLCCSGKKGREQERKDGGEENGGLECCSPPLFLFCSSLLLDPRSRRQQRSMHHSLRLCFSQSRGWSSPSFIT